MADTFIGLTISVTLKPPSNAVLHGKVSNVIGGHTLVLEQVVLIASGKHISTWSVPSGQIADLQVMDASSMIEFGPDVPPVLASHAPSGLAPPQTDAAQQSDFVDPAILSYGKSPEPAYRKLSKPAPQPATPSQPNLAAAAATLLTDLPHYKGIAPDSTQPGQNGKRIRKSKRIPTVAAAAAPQQVISPDVSRNGNDMTPTVKTKKGWRSTPLLQESGQDGNLLTPVSAKKSRPLRGGEANSQNGWATEDATDIQDLGDFDFEANLSKFDKRTVFDQIRNEDTTADEDRLVSHNRLPAAARPGTNGGKNLHPTENVLSPVTAKYRSSEVGSASDELNFDSGRAMSRSSTKRPPGRTNSIMMDDLGMQADMASSALSRSMSSLRSPAMRPGSSVGSIPNPTRTRSPQYNHLPLRSLDKLHLGGHPHFQLRASSHICPVLPPERLRQAEAEAMSTKCVPLEGLTENAARGIAAAIASAALRPGVSRRNSKSNSASSTSGGAKPVVVILAGNHPTGARAIASARLLYARGFKILISLASYSAPKTWHMQVARQIRPLQALGRKAARIEGWQSTFAHIKKLNGPPAVIVDALLDGVRYADLKDAEQATEAREMVDWANKSRAGVISVGCPSGYDAGNGAVSVLEGEPMAMRPDSVLALGAPVQGLLDAVRDGEGTYWSLQVVDIGLNVALAVDEIVPFGSDWTASLIFAGGVGEEDGA